jgi:putative endonuclease
MFNFYWVYIITNKNNTVLYTGVTNDLYERILIHREKINKNSFSARYNLEKLVYFEEFQSIEDAINREKQIKSGSRQKKIAHIENLNSEWKDLIDEVFE